MVVTHGGKKQGMVKARVIIQITILPNIVRCITHISNYPSVFYTFMGSLLFCAFVGLWQMITLSNIFRFLSYWDSE